MQSSFSIIALSIFSAFFGVQAVPSSEINRRAYGSTPSYSQEQPKAYSPKVEAYQPKQEVYTPKVEAYQPKKEVYEPEPVKPSYSPKPYVVEKPAYGETSSPTY